MQDIVNHETEPQDIVMFDTDAETDTSKFNPLHSIYVLGC